MAILEDGQRHDGIQGHGYDKPTLGTHACARKSKKGEIYCRYLMPREIREFLNSDRRGKIIEDPHRPELRNLFLERNDGLINNFEEHLLLSNLGNIDWRPLLNLWAVLEYLTKYTAKAGKGSKHLGKLFEDVLERVVEYETEDGMHDLWRRTIMKFYNKILGDRDYSLFEVVHFGLRLPGTLSSFGDVRSASVSNWATLKPTEALQRTKEHQRATNKSALELFNVRSDLKLPPSVPLEDLQNISFYAFSRMYDVAKGAIIKKQTEKFVALSGNGWPAQAKRAHELHREYARKTLHAYMPCYGSSGVEYIDAAVRTYYDGSYAAALEDFVMDTDNLWCPKWIKRNYEIQNKLAPDTTAPAFPADADDPHGPTEPSAPPVAPDDGKFPHSDRYKHQPRFRFEPTGEPEHDPAMHDTEREETHGTDYHWNKEKMLPWQLHSKWGPNPDLEPVVKERASVPFENLVNPIQPAKDYDADWADHEASCNMKTWDRLEKETAKYSDESLTRETLGDDYQQLFVAMVLNHAQHVIDCVRRKVQPEPMRLLLLGSAGAGKTRAVQTALQELQRALAAADLPAEIDVDKFVKVGAPTGTAAFNLRFNATTVHRLIHWFRPPHFTDITQAEKLDELQRHLGNTQLIILDEISMVGRQMMGRIDARCTQAKAGKNPKEHSVGGISCVGVGDPAQCEAIMDQQIYDVRPHKKTVDEGDSRAVLLSNRGLSVYSEFTHVIVLTKTHRLTKIDDPQTEADHAFNERAERFVQMLRRLRDLEWTIDDYYWLCKRKRSNLTLRQREEFATAPVLMDFRRTTADNPEDNCEFYNKGYIRQMVRESKKPLIRIDAQHEGTPEDDGKQIPETSFNGLPNELEVAEDALVILISNLAVEFGLMNGTQGKVVRIIFKPGHHPNHEDPACRQPEVIVVDFPKYAGPRFYDAPERATWVPLRAVTRNAEAGTGVTRTQFPLILGWAITPWKAQGMTLDRVIVRLTKAASAPGVAFVALSRVRHPDHLMLEDSFPDMSTIMRQLANPSYQARQRWERDARVKFSRTVRQHMRDPELYTPEKCWTDAESTMADQIVAAVRKEPSVTLEDVVAGIRGAAPSTDEALIETVAEKLKEFPHIFELAKARDQMDEYDLSGNHRPRGKRDVTHIRYQGWSVPLTDVEGFLRSGTLTTGMFELFAKLLHPYFPRTTVLRHATDLRRNRGSTEYLRNKKTKPRIQLFPYQSNSKAWALFVIDQSNEQATTLHRIMPETYAEKTFEHVTHSLAMMYKPEETKDTTWPSSRGLDMLFLSTVLKYLKNLDDRILSDSQAFLRTIHDIVERVQATCIKREIPDVEEALEEDSDLATAFKEMFVKGLLATVGDTPLATAQSSGQPAARTNTRTCPSSGPVTSTVLVPRATAEPTQTPAGTKRRRIYYAGSPPPAAQPISPSRSQGNVTDTSRPLPETEPPVRRRITAKGPVIEDASTDEQAQKRRALTAANTVVTEELILDPEPGVDPTQTGISADKREVHATAAESRKRTLEQRGMGDMRRVNKMARTSAANAVRDAQNTPAAARAERIHQAMLKRQANAGTTPPASAALRDLGKFARGMKALRDRLDAPPLPPHETLTRAPAPNRATSSAASSSGLARPVSPTPPNRALSSAANVRGLAAASSSSQVRPVLAVTPAHAHLARAARLDGVNAARELRYTTNSPLPADATGRGLENLGNTCYGNALLFALSKVPQVRRWLHEHLHAAVKPPLHSNRCPLCMLARDVEQLTQSGIRVAHTPQVMLHRATWNLFFNNRNQQDAHEAFQSLLERCDDIDASAIYALAPCRNMQRGDFSASAYRASTPYNQIFGNLQLVRTTCSACNASSELYERTHAHDISLATEENTTLDVLLTEHLGDEPLDAFWRCDSCHASGHGTKNTEVIHWPPVLAISFKRFAFNRRTLALEKIPRHIGYPMLFPIRAGVTYNLRSIIVHNGNAAGGHYVAYVRAHNEQRYYCNDNAPPRIVPNPMDVLRKQAYMLIYEK